MAAQYAANCTRETKSIGVMHVRFEESMRLTGDAQMKKNLVVYLCRSECETDCRKWKDMERSDERDTGAARVKR
jgi:hypothetical protein